MPTPDIFLSYSREDQPHADPAGASGVPPELRALRQDAGFQAFVTRLGMMPYWEKYGPPDACRLAQGKLECFQ